MRNKKHKYRQMLRFLNDGNEKQEPKTYYRMRY